MPNQVAPIYNPNSLWQVWNYNDIYTGPTGVGQYVPKVGDQVNKIVGNAITEFIVESVELGSMIAVLTPAAPPIEPTNDGFLDQLIGPVTGSISETKFVYIDKSVSPYLMAVDARVQASGSMVSTCKIFAGPNISQTGRVVSAAYDQSGNYVGENVPLELVASSAYNNNLAIKTVALCNTTADLLDGEMLSLVFYDINGTVVEIQRLRVLNTGFIRTTDAYAKAVVGIELLSPFLSSVNSTVINYPYNLEMDVANITGVVHYSDGSSSSMAVDGVKFSIAGLDAYSSQNPGQSYPIVAKYVLQPGEVGYGTTNVNLPHISQEYSLVTSSPNALYQTRLFVYPVWNNLINGYDLRWFLYDASRSVSAEVSNLVYLENNTAAFNPSRYGVKQTLHAAINLMSVDPRYQSFIHTQQVDITLEARGVFRQNSSTPPNWHVCPISGTSPMYGDGVFATFIHNGANDNSVNIAGIYNDLTSWLNAYYVKTKPLVNAAIEAQSPPPSHFTITSGGSSSTYTIDQWNATLTLSQPLINSDTVFIQFFVRTTAADLQLSVAGVPLYQKNSNGTYV